MKIRYLIGAVLIGAALFVGAMFDGADSAAAKSNGWSWGEGFIRSVNQTVIGDVYWWPQGGSVGTGATVYIARTSDGVVVCQRTTDPTGYYHCDHNVLGGRTYNFKAVKYAANCFVYEGDYNYYIPDYSDEHVIVASINVGQTATRWC